MKKKLLIVGLVIILIIVGVIVIGCIGSSSSNSTSKQATTTTTSGISLADISGNWERDNGTAYIQYYIASDGTWSRKAVNKESGNTTSTLNGTCKKTSGDYNYVMNLKSTGKASSYIRLSSDKTTAYIADAKTDGSAGTEFAYTKVSRFTVPDSVYENSTAGATTGEKNAVEKAKSYLNYTSFSYTGLIEQLKYEKFTDEEAKYGADHCGADWNEQAKKKAASYMKYSSFSKEGLIDQLEYEGFTHEQALIGAQSVGFN